MLRTLPAAALTALLAGPALAGTVNEENGVAIKGYDPVAYFTMGQPVEGSPAHTATHEEAVFRFASAANRDLFLQDPARYAPQYGGFCAFGTAAGYKADIDPAAFTIVDDKLYLNYDLDVHAEWAEDIPGYIRKGDANWPTVQHQTDVIR